MGVVTTKKNVGIAAILEKVLGPPSQHPTRFGLWWRCPLCHADLALTCNVWRHTWRCSACKRNGDALDLLAAVWRIAPLQAAARAGLDIPENEPLSRTTNHAKAKPKRSTGHCITGRRRR